MCSKFKKVIPKTKVISIRTEMLWAPKLIFIKENKNKSMHREEWEVVRYQ